MDFEASFLSRPDVQEIRRKHAEAQARRDAAFDREDYDAADLAAMDARAWQRDYEDLWIEARSIQPDY